jgi:hypothetical protein
LAELPAALSSGALLGAGVVWVGEGEGETSRGGSEHGLWPVEAA